MNQRPDCSPEPMKCPRCQRYLAHLEPVPHAYGMYAPCKCGLQTAVRMGGAIEPLTIPRSITSVETT